MSLLPILPSQVEKFHRNYKVMANGCWEWQRTRLPQGYGQMVIGSRPAGTRRSVGAHRAAFQIAYGSIPQGLDVHHVCANRACVNPAHLAAVTHRENVLAGRTIVAACAAKTHCIRGHEFSPENTYIYARNGKRECRTCRRDWGRRQCR